jgi:4-hydroxy-2-oxoheptanedioate aldolase
MNIGTMISEITTPHLVRVLAAAGFDFVVIDCEHGPFAYTDVGAIVTAGRVAGTKVHVRLPVIGRECVGRYLDLGVAGLIAPMVDDPEQARQLVALAHYPPAGVRGVSTQRPHSDYRVDDLAAYATQANASIELYCQIESRAGLDRAVQIAGVDGISGLVVGPNDLLMDLGLPGQHDHPELASAVRTVSEAAAAAGGRSGIISSRPAVLAHAHANGMDVLVWNSEIGLLLGPVGDALHDLRTRLDSTIEEKHG